MEIHADFWPGQRLSKKLSWRWGLYVSFSTAGLHPGSWIIDCQWVEKSSMWWFMSRKRDFYGVIWRCFARVKCGNIMSVFGSVVIAAKVIYCVIYRKCCRQILATCGWARVTRIVCVKLKNASWVLLWILNLFSADTEIWASRFDWLKDYNFWTFQMLFISSQNPVTSAREL